MQLDSIQFEHGAEGPDPYEISVTLTITEALWIAKLAGQCRSCGGESQELYSCLSGDVFNRYFDDGVDEADARYHVEIPPIKYED